MSVVLTIAGTDPSSAAGIQADLQVIRDYGHHGVSVITAVLAQNTNGVRTISALSTTLVREQLAAVLDDFDVAAVKVGLVPNDELVALVADAVAGLPVVWDPVLSSGDGRTPLFGGSVAALLDALRAVDVFTPNVPEAARLMARPIEDRADAHAVAIAFRCPNVLLKTGHLPHATELSDIWTADGRAVDLTPLPAVDGDVRGTGCHLSSAIACGLASRLAPLEAVEGARAYLNELLRTRAVALGAGRRLIAHVDR